MKLSLKLKCTAVALVSASMVAAAPVASSAPAPVNPNDYPKLDAKQMGHVRYLVSLADQLEGDWSRMGYDYTGIGWDWYRYQLAFQAYTLGVANYHYTPAYRELYQRAIDRTISKMFRQDTWYDWPQYSRGLKLTDPDLTELREGWNDPVVRENIMYSGHLLQMVNLYGVMYNDRKWEAPDSIKIIYNGSFGDEVFKYNNASLAKVIYDQYKEDNWVGISCEPNSIFTPCQTHPMLGLKHYDHLHNTKYFADIAPNYKKVMADRQYVDPKTGSFISVWLKKQNRSRGAGSVAFDGWTGMMQHAWDREYINSLYPRQRDRQIIKLADGTMTLPFTEAGADRYSTGHGFFAAYAAEIGDTATRDAMLAYADKYWSPKVVNGERWYPRSDAHFATEEAKKKNIVTRVTPLTGNMLLAMARLLPKDGLYTMYSKPFTAETFRQPYLASVRYPSVLVSQAVYDPAKKALVFAVEPGRAGQTAAVSWKIANLTPGQGYAVWIDGKRVAQLPASQGKIAAAGAQFTRAGDTVTVTAPLRKSTSFVVQAS